MATSPICLLQWLEPGEYQETKAALKNFSAEVNIEHFDVQTKDEADQALQTWFRNNVGNTQFCFVGAHGVKGLAGKNVWVGATARTEGNARWRRIWDWVPPGEPIVG